MHRIYKMNGNVAPRVDCLSVLSVPGLDLVVYKLKCVVTLITVLMYISTTGLCQTVDVLGVGESSGCAQALKNSNGVLKSPNYPGPYPPNIDCHYYIHRSSQRICGLTFAVDDLDIPAEVETGQCLNDWLKLPSCAPEGRAVGARLCGNNTPQVYSHLFQPGATSIHISFHAGNVSTGRRVFRIKYELLESCNGPYQTQDLPVSVIPIEKRYITQKGPIDSPEPTYCYTRIMDQRGAINTPFYPKEYPNNLDCVFEFIRLSNSVCGIQMKTVKFEVEPPIKTEFGEACKDFLHLPSCGFICGNISTSCGIFHDCAVHDIDLVCWVSGEYPSHAFASGSAFIPEISAMKDHDTVAIVLKFPSGALAMIDLSRNAVYGYDQRLEAFGPKGMLQAHNERPYHMVTSNVSGEHEVPINFSFPSRYYQGYENELDHFCNIMQGLEECCVSGDNTLRISKISSTLEESLKCGKMLEIKY